MVTSRNILTRLRQSYVIHALLSLSLGLLIHSNAESQTCRPCNTVVSDSPSSQQTCSDIAIAEPDLDLTTHDHGNRDCNGHRKHVVRKGCDETTSGHRGVTSKESTGYNVIYQNTDQNHHCECNMGDQSFPASCLRFLSTSAAKKSSATIDNPQSPTIVSAIATDLGVKFDFLALRCHSPTFASNEPTAMSGFGTQLLLC